MSVIIDIRAALTDAVFSGLSGNDLVDDQIKRLLIKFGGGEIYLPTIDKALRNRAIRNDRDLGYSMEEIARRNGCSRPIVRRVLIEDDDDGLDG